MCAWGKSAGKLLVAGVATLGAAAWMMAPRPVAKRSATKVPEVPKGFYAHRGLHDAGSGLTKKYAKTSGDYIACARACAERAGWGSSETVGSTAPENSLPSFAAACEAGYGIELDIQLTADDQVVVVHDSDMQRVAGDPCRIAATSYEYLRSLKLFDSDAPGAHVPLFSEVLELVNGRVPLIIEFKFPHNAHWGARERLLMEKGSAMLAAYQGAYVVESFHPGALGWYKRHRPEVCRGQLAEWPTKKGGRHPGQYAAGLLLLDEVSRPDFVAYHWKGGKRAQVRFAKLMGATAVSWTLRSAAEYAQAKHLFDRHIFEAFIPEEE